MCRVPARLVLFTLLFLALHSNTAHAQTASGDASTLPQTQKAQVGSSPTSDIAALQATVSTQQQRIDRLQGMVDAITKRPESNQTALVTSLAVVIAALAGGFFALRNQKRQAEQGRLLKAVEIIMESRSGYQADIRRKNLAVFLDSTTKKHLENIKDTFSGPEYTDLRVQLATAMSAQAKCPTEVLEIWKAVLKEKNVFTKVEYAPRRSAGAT